MKIFLCYCFHHTVIPSWIYRIPSELRSQARMGLPSTVVGDNTGIVGAVCFFVFVQIVPYLYGPFFEQKKTYSTYDSRVVPNHSTR